MMAWTYTRITPKVDESSNKYFGIVTEPPASGMIQGDSIVISSGESLIIKVYDGGQWKTLAESSLTSAEKSIILANAQADVFSAIQSGTVTSSEYAYFNAVVAQVITADYIKALQGVFDSIVVSGNSTFNGNFMCPTIESMPNTQGGQTYSANIPARSSSSSSSVLAAATAIQTFWTNSGLSANVMYKCNPINNLIEYIQYTYVTDRSGIRENIWHFYGSNLAEVGYCRLYGTNASFSSINIPTAGFNITISVGAGDILKFKGLQSGSAGLQNGQIYYTSINGHKVLCLV